MSRLVFEHVGTRPPLAGEFFISRSGSIARAGVDYIEPKPILEPVDGTADAFEKLKKEARPEPAYGSGAAPAAEGKR